MHCKSEQSPCEQSLDTSVIRRQSTYNLKKVTRLVSHSLSCGEL
uniref:Uncharacterized protein n=1 Tax=Anguilla anguilla TaxID=7936 RepID=A0A0E9P521_ANGAN